MRGVNQRMSRWMNTGAVVLGVLLAGCRQAVPTAAPSSAPTRPASSSALTARIIAVGIPGAGAVAPVGTFHTGGPMRDKPDFAAYTQAGRVLDPVRILVTSTANFGAPRARNDQPEGTALSIDPRGTSPLVVPNTFAVAGGQASTLDGKVQVFTAQNPAFLG